jgi:glycosyltransferase involved in cell wall biosynthesis
MKILFFSRSYKEMAGGIERKSLEIAKGLTERGHEVHIVSLDSSEDSAFYEWPENVVWHKANIGNPLRKASLEERLRRVVFVRKLLKQHFDVAIGFQVGAFALLRMSAIGIPVGVIAAERNAPTLFDYISFGCVKRFFSNLMLSSSAGVAILFPEFREHYPSYLQKKLIVTPNWVPSPISGSLPVPNRRKNQILFVGRFSFQKNLDCLLEATALLDQDPELVIIGAGDGFKNSKTKADLLELKCTFVNPTHNLSPYYESATLLCLPSRWEGFPNVAAEALAHGLPVVGFTECSGLPELVKQGQSGELAVGQGDPKSLSRALNTALSREYSDEFIRHSVSTYTFSNFINAWELACKLAIRRKL